jgi:F-type H+-transporting ATPase subunit alpha
MISGLPETRLHELLLQFGAAVQRKAERVDHASEQHLANRETGKTAIAADTIINQRNSGVISVYCAIGQKMSSVTQVTEAVKRHGALDRTIFVLAASDDPPGLQWLSPYAACTMAEYFTERGADALLVIDDLTSHAVI